MTERKSTKAKNNDQISRNQEILNALVSFSDFEELRQLPYRLASVLGGFYVGSYMFTDWLKIGEMAHMRITLSSTHFLSNSALFASKIILDFLWPTQISDYPEYTKGAVVGLISERINTPLSNIEKIQSALRYKISKIAAYQFMIEKGRQAGLYTKGSKINSIISLSLFFGVYNSLNLRHGETPWRYILNPFLASLCACIPINIIQIVKKTYITVQVLRQREAYGRGKRVIPKPGLSQLKNTILQAGGLFSIPAYQHRRFFYEFFSKWLMLSLFGFLQNQMFPDSNPTIFNFHEFFTASSDKP